MFGPLDFAVDAGEALLVQGDNGAGKTTLLRVLAGLLRADAGEIDIDGRRATTALRARAIAYLGHLPALKADLTARKTSISSAACTAGAAGSCPATRWPSSAWPATKTRSARQLSAGQKKRLSLARLWLSPAPLWLLDEPYANLDLDGINLVNRMVQAHLRDGGAALLTTHGAYAAPPVRTRMLTLERPA